MNKHSLSTYAIAAIALCVAVLIGTGSCMPADVVPDLAEDVVLGDIIAPSSPPVFCGVGVHPGRPFRLQVVPGDAREATIHYFAPDDIELPDQVRFEVVNQEDCTVVRSMDAAVRPADGVGIRSSVLFDGTDSESRPLPDSRYMIRVRPENLNTGATAVAYYGSDPVPACPGGGKIIHDVTLADDKLGSDLSIGFAHGGPRNLCIDVFPVDSEWALRKVDIDGKRLFPDSDDFNERGGFSMWYPSGARVHRLGISIARGDVRVLVREFDAVATEPPEPIECGGWLRGFNYPYADSSNSGQPARRIRREDVPVICTAYYYSPHRWSIERFQDSRFQSHPRMIRPVRGFGTTDENGRFALQITTQALHDAGIGPDHKLISVQSDCLRAEECGVDRRGASTANLASATMLPISGVVDLAFDGLVARLITSQPEPQRPAFAKSSAFGQFFSGWLPGPDARNDYPVAVHEAFDPLREDGTEALRWALGGQPMDYLDPDHQPGDTPRSDACSGEIRGPCYTKRNQLYPGMPIAGECRWTPMCSATADGNDGRFRCEAANALKPALESGYDFWLIDNVRNDTSLLHSATRSPALYQQILNYAAPNSWLFRDKRKLAVLGISAGGIVARVALRLWEGKGNQSLMGPGSPLKLARPDLFDDTPKRVALYASLEAPHGGAIVPLTFQGLVKDDDIKSKINFIQLLHSQMARELMQESVKLSSDINCVASDGKPRDCDRSPSDISAVDRDLTDRAIFQFFADEVADALGPGPRERDSDSLPKTIPVIAISNGSLTESPAHASNMLLEIKLKLGLFTNDIVGFDQIVPDDHIKLRDDQQIAGSGLPTYCRIEEIEASGRGGWFGAVDGNLRASLRMKPELGNPLRTYPTFVSTTSSLALTPGGPDDGIDEVRRRWHDALWEEHNQSHIQVTERHCRFLLYHLDGQMKGDKDGFPACGGNATNSCGNGGRLPGYVLDQGSGRSPESFCDPDDDDANVVPDGFRPKVPWGDYVMPDIPWQLLREEN